MSDVSVNFTAGTVGATTEQATGKAGQQVMPNQGTPGPRATADLVRRKWFDGARITRPEQRNYWVNRAFLRGEQWVYWDRQRDKLTDLPRQDERLRATVNKMRSASRRVSGRLNRRPLHFEVTPKAADDASINASAKAEAVLEHASKVHDFEWLRRRWWDATWQGGTAVLCIDWDPRQGTRIGQDPTTGREFGTGDINYSVLSVAECVAEPGSRNIETARWWIKILTLPPEQARDVYNLAVTPPADASMALSPFQTKVLNTDGREVPIPMTLVLVYYERPNGLCPDGQVATVIGNNVVEWSKWPFPWKHHQNCVALTESEVHDRWQGDTILTDAVPVQTGLNAAWSSILEHLKQAGNARLMVPEETLDIIDELTDNPGEIIPFNATGGAPSYLAPPSMPDWWTEMPEMLNNELGDILGLNDVSRGEAPANLESGIGLAILNESDDTPLGEMAKKLASAWSKVASMTLRLYADKVKETRQARIDGPGTGPIVVPWKGADLLGATDAFVPPEAIIPTSKAAQQAFAESLWDRKIITSATVYAKIAELPYRRDLLQGLDDDLARAERENYYMATGEVCLPYEWDDHGKHIQQHNSFRKTEKYEKMSAALRHIVDLHVHAHETLAAQAAGKMLAKQMVHPALASAPNAVGQGLVPDGQLGSPLPVSPLPNPAGPATPVGASDNDADDQLTGEPAVGSSAPGQSAQPPGL